MSNFIYNLTHQRPLWYAAFVVVLILLVSDVVFHYWFGVITTFIGLAFGYVWRKLT